MQKPLSPDVLTVSGSRGGGTHTQCNHLLWATGNFLPADRGGGGVTQAEVRPLVLARHQAGEQACSALIVVNRDGPSGVSLDRHVVNDVFPSEQKH